MNWDPFRSGLDHLVFLVSVADGKNKWWRLQSTLRALGLLHVRKVPCAPLQSRMLLPLGVSTCVVLVCIRSCRAVCVVRKVSSTVFVRIGKPSWHEETFVIQLNYPQSFHKIRISSAFLSQPVCLGTPMQCIGKKEFFLTLNSQLFCGKFCSCDQKLDDLVSRTATK